MKDVAGVPPDPAVLGQITVEITKLFLSAILKMIVENNSVHVAANEQAAAGKNLHLQSLNQLFYF